MKKEKKFKPLVSVLLPVYNAAPFLGEAILSVLAQSFGDFELVILDDASSDSSWKIIKSFTSKDKRIRAYRNLKNLGVGTSRFKLVGLARGDFLAVFDADDLMAENRLEEQVKFLRDNKDVVAVGSWMKVIDKQGKVVGVRKLPCKHEQIYQMMYYLMGLQHPSIMINKRRLPASFSWYPKGEKQVVDLPVLFQLLQFGKFANLPKFLTFYRIHGSNLSDFARSKAVFWKAQEIRRQAVGEYGYRPGFKARLFNFISILLVGLLPSSLVLPVYSYFRKQSFLVE